MTDFTDPAAVQAALDASPFQAGLGLRLLEMGEDGVVIGLPFRPGLARQAGSGQVHGGVLASLIDIAGDYALAIRLGHFVPTVDLRCDYLRPAAGDLRAEARVVRAGRTLGVADITVRDVTGREVAVGRGTYLTREG